MKTIYFLLINVIFFLFVFQSNVSHARGEGIPTGNAPQETLIFGVVDGVAATAVVAVVATIRVGKPPMLV